MPSAAFQIMKFIFAISLVFACLATGCGRQEPGPIRDDLAGLKLVFQALQFIDPNEIECSNTKGKMIKETTALRARSLMK